MRTVGVTGAGGMLGFHVRARLLAERRAQVVPIHAPAFDDEGTLRELVSRCDVVVHLAYRIVGEPDAIIDRNRLIAERLTGAMARSDVPSHLVFASSTHIDRDTPYGTSKRWCDDHFARFAEAHGRTFTSIIFPHIFGEGGRPFYNSVVATFCHQLARGEEPTILADADLDLLHAQGAAAEILRAIDAGCGAQVRPSGRPLRVSELLSRLRAIDRDYRAALIPDLSDPLELDLFNTYRSYLYPAAYPTPLELREDARGALFEAVRTCHGGQAFVSTTKPDVTRGNHFHLRKLERFCVVRGRARIRIRRLFSSEIVDFDVSSARPCVVDIPTLHTHCITNTDGEDLVTLFWAHEVYNPEAPDTFPEPVELAVA